MFLNIGPATIVLRKFDLNEDAPDGNTITIEGRASGFWAWFLAVLKVDNLTVLKLEKDAVSLKYPSQSGQTHQFIPLGSVDATTCSYSRPWKWIVFALIAASFGIMNDSPSIVLLGLICAAAFIAIYAFSKRIFISARSGGTEISIAYKRSIIEGNDIDFDKTLEAIRLLNKKIIESA